MTPATQKVGRITVAVGLVGFGTALLVDNLSANTSGLTLLLKLWPLILIGFGVEYLIRSLLAQRAETETKLRFDWGGLFLLLFVAVIGLGVATFRAVVTDGPRFLERMNINVGPAISRSDSWNIPAEGAKELVAEVDLGSVRVEQNSSSDQIRVEATYSIHDFIVDREEIRRQLDSIKMNVERGEVIRLTPEFPSSMTNVSIGYVIYAPAGLTVKATTGAGFINVQSYKGDLQLTSRVGRISVEAGSGSVSAASNSGYISIRNWEGPVAARTSVGALELSEIVGPIQLDSGTGMIQVREFRGGKFLAESRTGRIQADTQSPLESDVALKTQNGSVSLTVPKESSMRVSAQTRTGGLSVPEFMSTTRHGASSSAMGGTGDEKYTVTLEANTGSVTLGIR